MRSFIFILALMLSWAAVAQNATVTVEVDAALANGNIRDLFGANKKPSFASPTPGVDWNAASLYPAFGISQVRLHDSDVDLCTTYTAATKLNSGVTPPQAVVGCELRGSGGRPHFTWTPTSSADADLDNPNNYDFTAVDAALSGVTATGAAIYLRLGESYNGPNDTADPVAWAKVATNIYKHAIGIFKPTSGIAVSPVFVEIFNEPDGGAWVGATATFDTLFVETAQRVRAAAAAAGKTVSIGGAGFTRNVLANSAEAGNPANGFIATVGAATIDFYSAHLYGNCANATLASAANFLRSLRSVVNAQGGSTKPLQITEWNIGLGSQCGNAFFADQRTQSFDSGLLTLMQDPAQNIEAAHVYAAMPIMALFDFATLAGTARINPSAWALWAHSRLRGATMLGASVCPQGAACVAGYAAEGAPLLALAGQTSGGQKIVVTNDGSAAVNYRLRLKGLNASTVTATISTPPAGAQDLPASGNPIVADATALAALLAAVPKDTRSALAVSNGQVDIDIAIPAHSLQLVEVQTVIAPSLAFASGWNLVGNGVEAPLAVATVLGDATRINSVWKWATSGTTTGITYPAWAFYTPSQTDGGRAYAATKGYDFLTAINPGEGFWVDAKTAVTKSLSSGVAVQSSSFKPAAAGAAGGAHAVPHGWSLLATGDSPPPAQFAAAIATTQTAAPAAGKVYTTVNTLWAWDAANQKWFFWAPELVNNGALATYIASRGYQDFSSLPSTPPGTLGPASGFWINLP